MMGNEGPVKGCERGKRKKESEREKARLKTCALDLHRWSSGIGPSDLFSSLLCLRLLPFALLA